MWYVTRFDGNGPMAEHPMEGHRKVANGQACPHYRLVYAGPDKERASAEFDKIADKLRQGAVKLLDANFDAVASVSGPRLRSCW